MEKLLEQIRSAIWEHDAKKVKALTEQAVAEKVEVTTIVNQGLVEGMNQIGEKFKSGNVFIPEVLISARAMMAGMAVVKPLLLQAGVKEKGLLVIGAVKEDLHDIGKNIVTIMFEGAGYKVIDLGLDVSTEKYISAIEEHKPDFIGLAALLTTTMPHMRDTTQAIKEKYPHIKVIVGGAPVTQAFANEIGADIYAADAAMTVERANVVFAN
jgi:5-methyltetrahydrofolate--homocysteine methyltransferase